MSRPVIDPNEYDSESVVAGYSPTDANSGFLGAVSAPKRTVIVRPKPGAAPGLPGFLGWVAATHPELYNYIRVSLPDYVGDIEGPRSGAMMLGAIDAPALSVDPISLPTPNFTFDQATPVATAANTGPTSSVWSQITDTIKNAAAVILPTIQQQKLLGVQLDRAKAGLPPLDLSRYESASQGLNVGVNASTQRTLLYLGLGLGAIYLASTLFKHRSR